MLQSAASKLGSKLQLVPPTKMSAGKHNGCGNSKIGYRWHYWTEKKNNGMHKVCIKYA